MKELMYKDVAAFADCNVAMQGILETLLSTNIDSSTYDALVQLSNSLAECDCMLWHCHQVNSSFVHKKRKVC